jgi:hypothetical protein
MQPFNHDDAFSRNIGWLTRQEQDLLRHKCVALAGLGEVGGVHLLTLCWLGIGKYHLADFDGLDASCSKYPFTTPLFGFELAPRSREAKISLGDRCCARRLQQQPRPACGYGLV